MSQSLTAQKINLADIDSLSPLDFAKAQVLLEAVKVLYRLHGRACAEKFFTKHFTL